MSDEGMRQKVAQTMGRRGFRPALITAAGIFAALLMLMTLQVVFLAPSSTAGAISLEREKQTLELLITTPISSVAIVMCCLSSPVSFAPAASP